MWQYELNLSISAITTSKQKPLYFSTHLKVPPHRWNGPGAESREMGSCIYLVGEFSSGSDDEHSSKPPRMHLTLLNTHLKPARIINLTLQSPKDSQSKNLE